MVAVTLLSLLTKALTLDVLDVIKKAGKNEVK